MSDERRRRILILLETRNDAYPGAKCAAWHDAPGPNNAEARRTICGSCTGRGKVRGKLCLSCDGMGWRRPLRRLGETAFDEYVYEHDAKPKKLTDFQTSLERQTMTTEQMEGELRRLRQAERERAGIIDPNDMYAWERARVVQERHGSYSELDRALEVLRQRHPLVSPFTRFALGFLAEEMRGPIRLPQWLEDEERRRQSKLSVAELAEQGLSARKIARALGMNLQKVKAKLKEAA